VNFVKVDDKDVPMVIKNSFKKMIKLRSNAFADPNESLPNNINAVATIPTDEKPIYLKMYTLKGYRILSTRRLNYFLLMALFDCQNHPTIIPPGL